jgi:ABC-2 type transport system permease protein
MSGGVQQGWLVAVRELRERVRSKALWAGLAIMLGVVVAAIVVPAMLDTDQVTRDVGFSGAVPSALPAAVVEQGESVDVTVHVHHYDDVTAGEQAVREGSIDVLVVGDQQLRWRGDPDDHLRAIVTGAIQLLAVQDRAAAAGIDRDELAEIVAPVAVENDELGITAGRSPDDETAAYVMSMLLLLAVATYGQLVLTGVVQEKSSRVVEVLLARMPARSLLAGKVVGIGLLGFAQFAVTALAAVAATMVVDTVDLPAVSATVLMWVVVWFVLGYAVYAIAYGAVGSLASRVEDASSVSAPVTTVLIVGYWVSLVAVGSDAASGWSRFVSLFPPTAPFAMPGRIALGTTAWWEPIVAVVLTVVTIAGLVVLAGRVYTGAILHAGPNLKLREAWRATTSRPAGGPHGADHVAAVSRMAGPHPPRERRVPMGTTTTRTISAALIAIALALGAATFAITGDFVIGVAIGAGIYAIGSRVVTARVRSRPAEHPSAADDDTVVELLAQQQPDETSAQISR